MSFQKIASKKKSQMAAEMLLEEIKKKQFKVGERLPPERIIAKEMGVSRNTLREAIAALQIIGILEARHSQGNFIISLNVTEDMHARLEAVFANSDDPFVAVDARIAFEPGAAFLACQTATDEDILDIGQVVGRVASAIQGERSEGILAGRSRPSPAHRPEYPQCHRDRNDPVSDPRLDSTAVAIHETGHRE